MELREQDTTYVTVKTNPCCLVKGNYQYRAALVECKAADWQKGDRAVA